MTTNCISTIKVKVSGSRKTCTSSVFVHEISPLSACLIIYFLLVETDYGFLWQFPGNIICSSEFKYAKQVNDM